VRSKIYLSSAEYDRDGRSLISSGSYLDLTPGSSRIAISVLV